MPLVVGVSFRKVGKVYYFDPSNLELNEGDSVIAETARGIEFGEVVLDPREVAEEELVAPLKMIVRMATNEDLQREAANREKEQYAFEVCEKKIAEHNLPMKLLDAEYTFDGSQVTLSFSADGRVDFRELVKDVAGILHTKVQLHQIGVRDEAKLIGGYGGCGRPLCCSTFLSNFEPISMKMAKDQSLFLNPAKFSGCCGKLMCCLRYEHDHYKETQKQMPAVGAIVELEHGRAKVVDINVITNMLTVQTEEEIILHIKTSDIKLEGLCRKHGVACSMSEKSCQPLTFGDSVASNDNDDEDDMADDDIDILIDTDSDTYIKLEDDLPEIKPIHKEVIWRTPKKDGPAGKPSEPKASSGNRSHGNNSRRNNGRNKGSSRPHRQNHHNRRNKQIQDQENNQPG